MAAFYESPSFESRGPQKLFDGVTVYPADRQPCVVCGHTTGDCAPEGEKGPDVIWGYNTNSSLDYDQHFVIQDDIFEEREIAPGVVMKIHVYKKGKTIPLLLAKELGLI
jgi:hypothetical protein